VSVGMGVSVGRAASVCAAIVHAIEMAVACTSSALIEGVSGGVEPHALRKSANTKRRVKKRFTRKFTP